MPTPSPNDMPGADNTNDADDTVDTIEGSDTDQPETGTTELDPSAELDRLRAIHKEERKWERIAKRNREDAKRWEENKHKVEQWDELESKNRTETENLRIELERERNARAQAETQQIRHRIAAEIGVPLRAVMGDNEESMREAAQEYQDVIAAGIEAQLKARNIGPAAPASAVTSNGKPSNGKQLGRTDLESMNRKQVMDAYRSGQLDEALGKAT